MADKRLTQARGNAWLLDLGGGFRAAVGSRVLVHLIDQPEIFSIPCTPAYCSHVALWQDQVLPVMDIAARLGVLRPVAPKLLAVACYQEASGGGISYGAIQLAALPVAIAVDDATACALPEQLPRWRELAISCFDYQGIGPVPILHLGRLFSAAQPTSGAAKSI